MHVKFIRDILECAHDISDMVEIQSTKHKIIKQIYVKILCVRMYIKSLFIKIQGDSSSN